MKTIIIHFKFILWLLTVLFLGLVSIWGYAFGNTTITVTALIFCVLNLLNIFSDIYDDWFNSFMKVKK